MADKSTIPPEKFKLADMNQAHRETVIEVLKAGIVYKDLLGDFERRFVIETAGRYASYGSKLSLTEDQWTVFLEIASKLNLKVPA
jgi:hypothetical protein